LAEMYYFLGKNYQALKEKEKTEQFFRKALEIDPLVLYAQDIRSVISPEKKFPPRKRKKS